MLLERKAGELILMRACEAFAWPGHLSTKASTNGGDGDDNGAGGGDGDNGDDGDDGGAGGNDEED